MEEKKVPPVKKSKTTTTKKSTSSTKTATTSKATVKKHVKCKLYLVPNHTNLYYYFEENSTTPKFYREVKPRKPRVAKETTGEKMDNKPNSQEKKVEEPKEYPLEVREKVLANREKADKIVNHITSKEQPKQTEEKKTEEKRYPLEVREKILADREKADKIVNHITSKEKPKQTEEKKTEEKRYPLEVREKILADREKADKIVNHITSKEKPVEEQTIAEQSMPEEANKIAKTTPAKEKEEENNKQPSNDENKSPIKEEISNNSSNGSNDDNGGNNKNVVSKEETSKPAEAEKKDNAKKDEVKKDDSKKDDVKKDEPPRKKVLNVNKKLVGFFALLCATGAFFLVSPVLMFVALMLFETSLVMQSIEYNEFRPRRHPMSRREKGMERVARLENDLSKNQLTDEEINLLSRSKDKNLTPEEKKELKLVKQKQKNFNKASKQYKSSPYTSQPTDDFLKERQLTDSMKTQNNNFGKDKTEFLNDIQTRINNRKNLLKEIKENNIPADEEQINIIKNEIKSCEDYYTNIRDNVNNQEYYQNQKNLGYYQRTMDRSFLNNIEVQSTFAKEVENSKIEKPSLSKDTYMSLDSAIKEQKAKLAKETQAEANKDDTNGVEATRQ